MSSTSSVNSLLSSTATTNSAVNLSSMLAAESGVSTPGIDVTAAVAAAIYADRAPERIWQADQTTLTSQTSALTAIQTATQAIQTDMQSLNTLSGPLSSRTVYTSDSNEVTATATDGTTLGDHTVVVNNLATTASWYSGIESSPTAAISGSSSFTITNTAGVAATFATGPAAGSIGASLVALAASINGYKTSTGQTLGVTASVVTDSTGSRLAIVANSSGAASDFSITEPYTSWTAPAMASGETLGANTLTLTGATAGAGTATITTTSGETYTQLATAINGATDSNGNPLGVTATATGPDTNGNTGMTITSNDGITPFTINEPSSTAGTLGFTQAVAGSDASLTVDGVPIDSATNTVTSAIPGVTLNVLSANPGTEVGLEVGSNASSISTAINQFVSDYNTAIGLVNAQYTVSSTTNSAGTATNSEGVLASDPTVSGLQSALAQAINYVYTPTTGSTTVSSLSDLGITEKTDGTLAVDSTTLDNALTNNPNDVQNFFDGPSLNGFANALSTALNTFTEPATGAFTVDLSSMATQNSDLTSQINEFESSYIANQQTVLQAEYSKAEEALQSLPEQMQQLNAELGFNSGSNNG